MGERAVQTVSRKPVTEALETFGDSGECFFEGEMTEQLNINTPLRFYH